MNFLNLLFFQPTDYQIQITLTFLRIILGILTIGHGLPKIKGGKIGWKNLGTTIMFPLNVKFVPTMWGFLGAVTEFFGGILLALGLFTRIASFCLIIMMTIATAWHIQKRDSFMIYSFPLTLIFVYFTFLIIGGGIYSLDYYYF